MGHFPLHGRLDTAKLLSKTPAFLKYVVFAGKNIILMLLKLSLISSGWHLALSIKEQFPRFGTHLSIQLVQHRLKYFPCHPCLWLTKILYWENWLETPWCCGLPKNHSSFLTTSCISNQWNCYSVFCFLSALHWVPFLPSPWSGRVHQKQAVSLKVLTCISLKQLR